MKVNCSSGAMAVTEGNEKNCAFWELREGGRKTKSMGGRGRRKKRGKTGMEKREMQIMKNEEENDDIVMIIFLSLTVFE
jgi:hypothetical protein